MSLPWSSKGLKATPVNADELLIIDSADANPSTQNKRITIGTLPSATLPVPDTTAIVEGSVDATKLLRFEIDGFTTATTRILTPPDADGVIVLEDFAQTLTNKTIAAVSNTLIIASTDLTDTANIVLNNQANSYTAGTRQNFLGDTAGTSGLNVGGIAGNPTTQTDGDLWLNTSSNILFARINGADVNLSAAGEVFTWSANHDANGFALEAPLRTIVENAGGEASVILNTIKDGKGDFGYDAGNNKFVNMFESGIIDPTKVTRLALENAASIAGLLLTTEAVVADQPEPEPAMPAGGGMPPGGMGGMM